MNKCRKCGAEFDSPFCPNCGAPVEEKIQATPYVTRPGASAPLPVRPKKKNNTGLIIGIIIAAFIIIGIFGSSKSDDTKQTVSKDTTEVKESSEDISITESEIEEDSEVESETVSISEEPQMSKEDFISLCQPADYKTLARYPDEHIGDKVSLTVQIQQILQGGFFDDNQYYRVYTDNDGYGTYFSDEYFMYDFRIDDDTRLLETDIITIYGEYAGLETVTRALSGTDEYVPAIKAYYIDIKE